MDDSNTTLLIEAHRAHKAGEPAPAEALCRRILAAEPGHAGALNLLGLIAYDAGNLAEAIAWLREASRQSGVHLVHLVNLAELCRKAGLHAEAEATARRAVALDAASAFSWFCLGNMQMASGRLEESLKSFEQAVKNKPNFFPARNNLATVLGRLGRPADAARQLEAVLAETPDNVEAHSNLCLLLQELGRFEDALNEAEKVIALKPESPVTYIHASQIELQLGRYWAALARLGMAERFRPGEPTLQPLKIHLLRLVEAFDDAVECGREALAAGPETSGLLHAHGLALQMTGDTDEALAMLDRSAATADNPAAALSDKGVLLAQLGRFAEAEIAFDQALAHDPDLAAAWYSKANAKTYMAGDPELAVMSAQLDRPHNYQNRIWLHFGLGKAHMDAGDWDVAFRHWHEANRLKRAVVDYDAAEAERQMAEVAAVSVDFADEPVPEHPDRLSAVPVFVVGMPRSGSSLIEQILASHPDIHGAGELVRFWSFIEEGSRALNTPDEAGVMDQIATGYLARLRHSAPDALRIIDKDLTNFLHLGLIHRLFPKARIIHCRRDPLDTCFSAYTKLFQGNLHFSYEQSDLGRHYRAYHGLMAHWRRALPAETFIEVDYEALVQDLETEARRLVGFLGLPWHEACLNFFQTERLVRTASLSQVRRPIYRSSIGRAQSMRRHLAPLIEALGDLTT